MSTETPNPTAVIKPNEKCWVLREYDHLTADYKQMRRYQSIYLVRDGEMREFKTDLGPSIQFPGAPEIRIVSLGEDTVAEMQEQALAMRVESRAQYLLDQRGPSDLMERYVKFAHERWQLMHNRSVFGPAYKRERNLFARKRQKYGNPA